METLKKLFIVLATFALAVGLTFSCTSSDDDDDAANDDDGVDCAALLTIPDCDAEADCEWYPADTTESSLYPAAGPHVASPHVTCPDAATAPTDADCAPHHVASPHVDCPVGSEAATAPTDADCEDEGDDVDDTGYCDDAADDEETE